MRRSFALLAVTCATHLATVGCADIFHLDDYAIAGEPQASAAPPPDPHAPSLSLEAARAIGAGPRCETNADCASDGSAVCVGATRRCAPLASPSCPRVFGDATRDDAVIVGAILEPHLEASVRLAAAEIAPARPLVVVACDPPAGAVAAARHLVDDLHVPAIVGPTDAEDVVEITQQVTSKGGTLVMTPTSSTSAISNLSDDDLTWRNVPSDSQRANLVIDQMSALENVLRTTRGITTVRLGIVHRTDAVGLSARDSISGKLIINGRFINDAANAANVSIDAYAQADDAAGQGAIATRYAGAFAPDIVFVTAPEQIANVVVPLEQALTAARAVQRPYYVVTEAAKTQELLDVIGGTSVPADLRRRIRGIGATSDTKSAPVFAGFMSRFSARYGASPRSFADAATYDATYAVAYAIAAGGEERPTGASVAHGLRALGVGSAVAVGPGDAADVMQSLTSGKSVSLRGANTLMQWDPRGDLAAGTVEVWCIGTAGGTPSFGSSGLTMDVETQVVGGAFVQCQ